MNDACLEAPDVQGMTDLLVECIASQMLTEIAGETVNRLLRGKCNVIDERHLQEMIKRCGTLIERTRAYLENHYPNGSPRSVPRRSLKCIHCQTYNAFNDDPRYPNKYECERCGKNTCFNPGPHT